MSEDSEMSGHHNGSDNGICRPCAAQVLNKAAYLLESRGSAQILDTQAISPCSVGR